MPWANQVIFLNYKHMFKLLVTTVAHFFEFRNPKNVQEVIYQTVLQIRSTFNFKTNLLTLQNKQSKVLG